MAKEKTKAPTDPTPPPTGAGEGASTATTGGETAANPTKGRTPELRKKLGEPEPTTGAKVDPKTGRVESAPGFEPSRRKPQTA